MAGVGQGSSIRGVRCIEIEMSDPSRAAEFYSRVWNLELVSAEAGSFYFRGTGAYHHVLVIHPAGKQFAVRRIVFDAVDIAQLEELHRKIKSTGYTCEEAHTWQQPGGGYGFSFRDPEGRHLAAVCNVADHSDTANRPDRPRKIVHVNLNAADVEKTNAFMVETLGFRLIDQTPVLHFFHCNSLDHSAIVVCGAEKPTINHVAFELPDLESVMRGAGRMRDAGYPVEWGVGRHSAGNNVFAYFAGPEEFPLEYTAEVTQVDESYVSHGPEFWRFPIGRMDQWGVTPPHSQRWKRIQDMYAFADGDHRAN